jgi:hypothetical protein
MRNPESAIFKVLRETAVVDRESFTLATFDSQTGSPTGGMGAHEFAAALIAGLGLCSHPECPEPVCNRNDVGQDTDVDQMAE